MGAYDTDILLATYNGAQYLPQLLASLDRQADQNWRLLARDDGSSDETVAMLRAWGRDKGARFVLLEDEQKGLGATGNFNALMQSCDADYFLLCDQDDVWLEDKVARLGAEIREQESKEGARTPLIVHTDLIVVDHALNTIAKSFWDYQKIRMLPEKDPWKLMTLQNTVTGCAMIGNAALLKAALPIPEQAIAHDWWLAMICALQGRITRLDGPSIFYRQHVGNVFGAQKHSAFAKLKIAASAPHRALEIPNKILEETRKQADEVAIHLGDNLRVDEREFLLAYSKLADKGAMARKLFGWKNGLYFQGGTRNLALYLAI